MSGTDWSGTRPNMAANFAGVGFHPLIRGLDSDTAECQIRELPAVPADISRHINRLRAAAAVLVVTENYPLPGFDFPTQIQHTVIERLVSAGIAPIVLGLRDPYDVQALPNVRTYVTALGYAPACARASVSSSTKILAASPAP